MPGHELTATAPDKGSVLYRHFGDGRAGFFAVHALLLQVMHPDVGAGVTQHSDFKNEAWKRLTETVLSLANWVYGGQRGARLEAARLRELHVRIAGTRPDGERYTALNPEPWAWVFATLLKGSLDAQQFFGRRLKPELLEEIYQEGRQLGAMMGIRPHDLPDTYPGFEAYFDEVVRTKLRRTEASDDVLWFIRHVSRPAPLWFVPRFVWRLIVWFPSWMALAVTAGTLAPQTREELGLKYGPGRKTAVAIFRGLVRAVAFILPQRVMVLMSVLMGKVGVIVLEERAYTTRDQNSMKLLGQWDRNYAYASSPQLVLPRPIPLPGGDWGGLSVKRIPELRQEWPEIRRMPPPEKRIRSWADLALEH